MSDNILEDEIELPCGAIGYCDGMGYRCEECMAIWGSIGCSCSQKVEHKEINNTVDKTLNS